ncbi:MAG: DUF533 domain-containing protein [Rhodocyclaceae bacterium]|nr:DUF533 domain-containing protein [Rhodocyclaceae bacterium]MCP5240800.1 DUF533 domain-containing protein [Zoogloeaceae bacterium]MCP5253089.1 DUF533 domain-containing protein [Zoogloeaceae bacterium]MCP5293346.1 DUF533 domain-containing protein [Zoogloeaceae bacterium]MCW5613982.1 DUF533 domain-containing protein [Rhodocyclaceae bacterium]
MTPEQQHAILSIALLAAFADGANDAREREQIRRLADSLGDESGTPDLQALYQRVLLKQVSLDDAAAALTAPEHRQLAYEMAVGICDADGHLKDDEKTYLARLAAALQLDRAATEPVVQQAEEMAGLLDAAAPAPAAAPNPPTPSGPTVDEAGLDRSILNYAILNGALELLPQSWASMAIIPLQMKMVYRIGTSYGAELDQGHIRELLATLGVGLTSQYLEQFGRKLLGGLFGKAAGKMAGRVGRTATGVAFSFATTYALGQVARRYYAGGRQMSSSLLKQSFQEMLGPAKQMQSRYISEMQQKATTLDAAQIMSMVRG